MVKARILRKVEWTATDEDHKPDVSFMPMMVRRRLSMVERAALHVAWTMFNPKEEMMSWILFLKWGWCPWCSLRDGARLARL